MLRSMYSAISGLRNHQTKLDVIGNNISNVNTHGFKKSRTIFKDLISQNISNASGVTESRGGTNPKQVGLGATIAAIDTIHSTGSLQSTARTLDLAIKGDGYFQVADSVPGLNGFTDIKYTRAGNFYLDKNGYLVNMDGKYLVGYEATTYLTGASDQFLDADGVAKANPTNRLTVNEGKIYNGTTPVVITLSGANPPSGELQINLSTNELYFVDANGKQYTLVNGTQVKDESNNILTINTVTGLAGTGTTSLNNLINNFQGYTSELTGYKPIRIPTTAQSMSIGQDGIINFVDKNGALMVAGKIQLAKFSNTGGLEKVGSNYYQESSNSGAPLRGFPTEDGIGSIESGFLEMSNVDLSEEFTEMIVAQRGFQANARIITTSEEILEELINIKR